MTRTAAIAGAVLVTLSLHAQTPAPATPPAAPPAPQAPKNVKVLTGLSREELMRTMQLMRASLGVRCEFCHVEGPDGLDFPNDAKEEKQTAREMIEMVKRINTTSFEGRPVVSCYTCHHGSEHPVNIVPLPTSVPPPAKAESTTPPASPNIDAIIASYVKASAPGTGSRTMRGTMTDVRGPATIEVAQMDGTTKLTTTMLQRTSSQVYAGNSGWAQDRNGTHDMAPGELQRFREVHAGLALPKLDAKAEGWRPARKDRIGDRDAWRIDRRASESVTERYWFDAQSGVLLRMMTITAGPVGRVPQQVDFSDYRQVGGVSIPFTITNSMVDTRASNEKKFDTIEATNLDAKRFDKE